jgi:small subunit ribosomal protein S20
MPNIKSAKKRMKLSAKARVRNRAARARIRTAIKRVRETTAADVGQARLRDAVAILDRAANSRLVHPNRVARIKSGLTRHVRALA